VAARLSFGEALALERDLQRPVRFLFCATAEATGRAARWLAIPDARRARDADELLAEMESARRAGRALCLLADGLSVEDLEKLLRQTAGGVVPLAALDDSRLKLSRNFKMLGWRGCSRAYGIGYGPALEPENFTAARLQQALLEVAAELVHGHPALQGHLAGACLRGLKNRPFRTIAIDTYAGGRKITGAMLLAVAWLLAEWLEENIKDRRVGIVLPPGIAVVAANLACLLAGKTPVNLNFTIGRAANEHAIRLSGVRSILTTEAVRKRVPDFPWTESCPDVVAWLTRLSKKTLLLRCLRVLCRTTGGLARELRLPTEGGDAEAGLLFTSGSSGDPKGVVLSHRNILANTAQIDAILPPDLVPSMLGCLPIFHSFGFTVSLWWPLVSGPRVVTCLSPLDIGKILEAVEKYRVALLVTTPTFLRGYLKKAKPEQLRALRLAVTGAEKLPVALQEEVGRKLDMAVFEGYGMTETSPVISVNLPEGTLIGNGLSSWLSGKVGSVGRPVPGVAVKVTRPGSNEALPLGESGMLHFRGANVFTGYLQNPGKTAEVLADGWYQSGDVGRLDAEGFLHIEGRLSRFSKIGGEMVPHGTVEQHLLRALRQSDEDDLNLVVMGVGGGDKGEALVVVANRALDRETVRRVLSEQGLPNLWIPRLVGCVESLPHLASGKLDLRACQNLADGLSKKTESE